MKYSYSVVLITVPNKKEAQKISQKLVAAKLAACVNIVPSIESIYWWQGKIEKAKELLLVIKTLNKNVPALITQVKKLHSYTVPEIIALDIIKGNKDYLDWIETSLSK